MLFKSAAELENALDMLAPRPKKPGKDKRQEKGDTSKANRSFTQSGIRESVVSAQGRARAAFEQQRCVLHCSCRVTQR